MLSKISFVMSQFHVSKGTLAFLAWPLTSGNFVRIFCHLHGMCVPLCRILKEQCRHIFRSTSAHFSRT